MRKILLIAACGALLPLVASAQVGKQVEVTKAYVPRVEHAPKLPAVPDMTDTARMRPDIDYTITPLSLKTSLETRPIRPASVTYWQFNRPMPFYIKVGAGYPSNSVLDFYAATQNPGTGYVVGYLNHEGHYAKITNDLGFKNPAMRMTNRMGAAAGKYFGKRTLEADLSYEHRLYHRYGLYEGDERSADLLGNSPAIGYSDADLALRFGDDFLDLNRFNFEVAVRGNLFYDHSDWHEYTDRARQMSFGADARVARGFGRHRLSAGFGYEYLAGKKAIDGYLQQLLHASLRYGLDGNVVALEVGADYYHDKNDGLKSGNYILPFLRLDLNLGLDGLKPFLELDGSVRENSFRSLTCQNPYVASPAEGVEIGPLKSSVDYNGRLGIGGNLWHNRFNYRVYVGLSIRDNHVYWAATPRVVQIVNEATDKIYPQQLRPLQGRQTVTSFNGEAEWRPVSALRVNVGVHGFIYKNDIALPSGAPAFRGDLGLRYEGRKIAFGISASAQSQREWRMGSRKTNGTPLWDTPVFQWDNSENSFVAPFAVDLRADFEWKITGRMSLFAQGSNLANSRLYEYPWYREYGAGFTLGIKASF